LGEVVIVVFYDLLYPAVLNSRHDVLDFEPVECVYGVGGVEVSVE
jgi:hypothetical protein